MQIRIIISYTEKVKIKNVNKAKKEHKEFEQIKIK